MNKPLDGLRAARHGAQMTVTAAGEIVGKTGSHYSKIERGAVTLSANDALKLSLAFGVTVEALLNNPTKET